MGRLSSSIRINFTDKTQVQSDSDHKQRTFLPWGFEVFSFKLNTFSLLKTADNILERTSKKFHVYLQIAALYVLTQDGCQAGETAV